VRVRSRAAAARRVESFLGIVGFSGDVGASVGKDVEGYPDQRGNADDADPDGCAAGVGEIGVGGFDLGVLDPPADAHEGDGQAEEPETYDAGQVQKWDEHQDEEWDQESCHDLQVTGVAAGGADPGCVGGGLRGGGAVDGGSAELAGCHGGVDGLAAVGAGEDFDSGREVETRRHAVDLW
jgi:hypothetical protein